MSSPRNVAANGSTDSTSSFESDAKQRFLSVAARLSGLLDVERVIQSKLTSDAPLLEEIPRYLLSLGGKRIRPMLTLLVYQLFKKSPSPALIDVAAGIELIHMATLLHDDIIDRSSLRRHQTSPYRAFGLPGTLLAGDFLLVRAFALCAHLDEFIINATEQACVELTEGEILETSLQKESHSVESSLRIAQKKTASLFRLSCESAGYLAGLIPTQITLLGAYGENLGIAFQIVDDILDVISSEESLGKMPGTDIRERKPSIINVLWLSSGDRSASQALTGDRELGDSEIATLVEALKSNPILDAAKSIALEYVKKSEASIEALVAQMNDLDQATLGALRALSQYALERME